MARKGPLLTLLGGGVLAGILLVANVMATAEEPDLDGDLAGAQGAPPTTAAPEPAPTDTEEPTPEPTFSEEPTAEPSPEPDTYVGRTDDEAAAVALVFNGDEVTGYVCDGVTEAWMNGEVTVDGELELTGEEAELTATYDGDSAQGEVTAGGQTWSFEIEFVAPPDGLYRVADSILGGAEVDGAWIVLPDGTQIGVLTVRGDSRPAPELDTEAGEVTVDGDSVPVDRLG
jgi:serine/threonine-protein kinase